MTDRKQRGGVGKGTLEMGYNIPEVERMEGRSLHPAHRGMTAD